jgi:hypothetical protein
MKQGAKPYRFEGTRGEVVSTSYGCGCDLQGAHKCGDWLVLAGYPVLCPLCHDLMILDHPQGFPRFHASPEMLSMSYSRNEVK